MVIFSGIISSALLVRLTEEIATLGRIIYYRSGDLIGLLFKALIVDGFEDY